ncbi:exodeoxyribonuclease 10 [Ruegeria sp. TrichCH4B]|nr:exodeoxyribonuclease 10 [Ruegeria sp. TrichCH4B]
MDLTEAKIIRVIDYETTGTQEDENAQVIEFGRVDVDLDTLGIVNPFRALAKPSEPIPPVTMAVHHITDTDVADAPPPGQVWQPFWDGCRSEDYVAAHNAKFEQYFHDGNGRKWICTYKSALVVWPDAPSHGNQALRYWLGIDNIHPSFDRDAAQPPHRALPDAYVTAHILLELLKHKTPEELVQISEYPALLTTLRFGKHKGMKYSEAPTDYLDWIVNKSDLDEDTKFSSRYWLKKRGAL